MIIFYNVENLRALRFKGSQVYVYIFLHIIANDIPYLRWNRGAWRSFRDTHQTFQVDRRKESIY